MNTAAESRIGRWAGMIAAAVPELAAIRGTVENELLAMATLHALHAKSLLPREAVFIGGTCLRLCHAFPSRIHTATALGARASRPHKVNARERKGERGARAPRTC